MITNYGILFAIVLFITIASFVIAAIYSKDKGKSPETFSVIFMSSLGFLVFLFLLKFIGNFSFYLEDFERAATPS